MLNGRVLYSLQGGKIFTSDAVGNDRRQVVPDSGVSGRSTARWSPDGTRIAYSDGDDIWIVPAQGGTPERITSTTAYDRGPDWSPDGGSLVFGRDPGVDAPSSLVVLESATGVERPLLVDNADDMQARWSPDGSELAFVSDRRRAEDGFNFKVFAIRLDGRGLRLITDYGDARSPTWSPDGTLIMYGCERNCPYQGGLWTAPVAGGTPTQFLPNRMGPPDWAPAR